jgi:hypothetical protein
MWHWFEDPNNRLRLARFGAVMSGLRNMSSAHAILEGSIILEACRSRLIRDTELAGYAWENLPDGSLVVDVGGGIGSRSLALALRYPNLRFVVQDREFVVRASNLAQLFTSLCLTTVLTTVLGEEDA